MDFLRAIFPIFLIPTNYREVLLKLASFAFWEVWLITFFLRNVKEVDLLFTRIERYGKVGEFVATIPNYQHINIFGFVIAFIVAAISHIIQLHDKISDTLGIRRRFDRNNIILPLGVLVGSHLTPNQLNSIPQNRNTIMTEIFYRYASSRADNPLVDKHNIEHAIGAWAWFWIAIEAIFFAVISLFIFAAFSASGMVIAFLGYLVVLFALAFYLYNRVERLVRPEIEQIVADPTAKQAIKNSLNAL